MIEDPAESLDAGARAELMVHIATASFSDDARSLQEWTRIGAQYVGRTHPSKPSESLTATTVLSPAEWHATKHSGTGEWDATTTTAEYLDDIRSAVLHPCAILDVGVCIVRIPRTSSTRRRAQAGVRTDAIQARSVLKKATITPGRHILTVYAVDTRKLTTAYQLESSRAAATVNAWSNHRTFLP